MKVNEVLYFFYPLLTQNWVLYCLILCFIFPECIIQQSGLGISPQVTGGHWARAQRRRAPSKAEVAQLVDVSLARPNLCHCCFRDGFARREVSWPKIAAECGGEVSRRVKHPGNRLHAVLSHNLLSRAHKPAATWWSPFHYINEIKAKM